VSEVIDKLKEKYPVYKDKSDDELTVLVGKKYPQYLDRDPQFQSDFNRLTSATSTATTPPPAGAESGLASRDALETSLIPRGTERSTIYGGPRKPLASYSETMASVQSEADSPLARLIAPRQSLTEPRVELPKFKQDEKDSFLKAAGKEAVAAVESVPEFLTSDAGILSAISAKLSPRLVSLGFSADMTHSAYQLAKQAYRNWGTMTPAEKGRATVQILGSTVFGGLAGVHAVRGAKGVFTPEEKAAAPAAVEALQQSAERTQDAIHSQAGEVLPDVREQPGGGEAQVPAQEPGAEAGARGAPAAPEKAQVVASTYTHPETGVTTAAANHPEARAAQGVEPSTREGREQGDDGFLVQQPSGKTEVVSRSEGEQVAAQSGQLQEKAGAQVHSDEIASPEDPTKTLGEVSQEPQVVAPALGPQEGMGAAKYGEVGSPTGQDVYGIAQRVREERAQAGQVDPILPGEGTTVTEMIDLGNRININDPQAPLKFLAQFEADPSKGISSQMVASVRQHGETLAQLARETEERFGTSSIEYESARNALSEWDRRIKPMQTEWHKVGESQQSATDLDTGSVIGLERERMRIKPEGFSPEERITAGEHAKEVKETTAETDKAAKAVNEQLQNEISPEREAKADEKKEADSIQAANEAADKVDEAEKNVQESTTSDTRKAAEGQLKAARKAQAAANETVRRKAANRAKSERKVKERKELDEQAKATKKALDAAKRTVREWAVARAEAENKARVAQSQRDKEVARIQLKAAKEAEKAVWKVAREAARRHAELERKIVGDGATPVWEKARQYLDKGIVKFDDLRAKVAADLGMPVDQVTRLLARSKKMKRLTDDLWLKQQRERNTKTKAKLWVQGLDVPAYEKFIAALPRALFSLRVGFHGTVALGTHAPAVAFDPRFWGTYVRDFGKMYHMVGDRSFYEAQMQDLGRRPNYAAARRGGLVNDPFKYEGFDRPGITSAAADKISKAMTKALDVDPKWFTTMGERGYSILKVLRQDMFDQHWDNLPRQMQTTEMAKGISDAVNHITGVVTSTSPKGADWLLFAPKLQMSRGAFLFVDPFRAAKTGARMAYREAGKRLGVSLSQLPEVTPAEKYFAANEIKTKAYIIGTLGSLLALNQGILSSSGSDQKINLTDPLKSDFGKFKVAGLNLSYGNPLLTMARLPLRLGTLAEGPGGKLRRLIYPDEDAARIAWEYFRSQFSPFASLAADQVFREDWQKRQLGEGAGLLGASERPEPKRLEAQGIEPYTAGEYWVNQALPIPFQELMRESWKEGFGIKPVSSTLFMALTGGRVSEDYSVEHAQ
jgi:hypothetical protein